MSTQKKKETTGKKKEKSAGSGAPVDAVVPRLFVHFNSEVIPKMKEQFKYKSVMQVPKIEKIVVNAGLGRATQNIKIVEQAVRDLASITGQKPVSCKSKKAISNFKLRAGLPIGVMVTLRGRRMYEFMDRLLSLALPRIKDFRGISDKGFDGRGNYTLGLKEHLVFPEVEFDTSEATFGMNITFVTTANNDDEGRTMLGFFGFPFRKKPAQQKAA